jgi:hypothetical protein
MKDSQDDPSAQDEREQHREISKVSGAGQTGQQPECWRALHRPVVIQAIDAIPAEPFQRGPQVGFRNRRMARRDVVCQLLKKPNGPRSAER